MYYFLKTLAKNWALFLGNLNLLLVNNKGSDQPVHLHCLIRTFAICFLDSIIAELTVCKKINIQ